MKQSGCCGTVVSPVTGACTSVSRLIHKVEPSHTSSVLFFSPQSGSWPHHGRTFSVYLCPLSFWLTLNCRAKGSGADPGSWPSVCMWLFHGESCSRLDVVHPGRAWSSSPACTWHCSVHYLFLQATHLPVHNSLQLLPIALKLHNYEQVSAVEIFAVFDPSLLTLCINYKLQFLVIICGRIAGPSLRYKCCVYFQFQLQFTLFVWNFQILKIQDGVCVCL